MCGIALVILAAGIGSRYGEGIKQLPPIDDNGHLIIDYSIHDAIAAGFNRIVFINRHDNEEDFRTAIGNRIEKVVAPLSVSVAYAGIDSPPDDSGQVVGKHKKMSEVGSSALRRTLFLVVSDCLQNSPMDQPVFQFMNRKRAEGKPYKVYMMAAANKFLRIYYATVKAYLNSLNQT